LDYRASPYVRRRYAGPGAVIAGMFRLDDEPKNLGEPIGAPRSEIPVPPVAGIAPHDGRRALLTGGLAAGSLFVTLASRPALAASSCTISGMTSGIGSIRTAPSVGGCGSPPSCWSTRTSDWIGFSGTTKFTTTFMSGVASAMGYYGTDSFSACLTGTTTPVVYVAFGSSVAYSPVNTLAQCVAAVLNASLFGSDNTKNAHDYYNHGSVSKVKTTINNYLKAASQGRASVGGSVGRNNSTMASNATTCMNSLTNLLTGWNTQGGSAC
jgi:hypothetical protein